MNAHLAWQHGSLAFSQIQTTNNVALLHAASWYNTLSQLGLSVPFFLVHDLGLLLSQNPNRSRLAIAPRELPLPQDIHAMLQQYQQVVRYLSQCEVAQASRELSDQLVAVLLTRLFRDIPFSAERVRTMLPTSLQDWQGRSILQDYQASDQASLRESLRVVLGYQVQLISAFEQFDLETLQILDLFQEGNTRQLDFLDTLAVFSQPEIAEIIRFSLELLPSVLNSRPSHSAQTFAVDGIASLERHGSIDSLLPSEFAFDDEIVELKFLDSDLYFYGREREQEREEHLHYVMIDASASMRGLRSVFARGLSLVLLKKLHLQQQRACLRFFDSRLYDLHRMSGENSLVPYLLSFKSEHGRNYTRVFEQLLPELLRIRRDEKCSITLYLVTHGQCQLPVPLVERLREVATLCGIVMFPSEEVQLPYLGLLHHCHIVKEETLYSSQRADRAREILRDSSRS